MPFIGEARHSPGAHYKMKENAKIEGTVEEFVFGNPHWYVLIREASNDQSLWSLEWDSAKKLRRQGVQEKTVRVGDYLTVTGHPPRNPLEHRMRIRLLTRENDGFKWKSGKGQTVR
jgi:hypothetical protein